MKSRQPARGCKPKIDVSNLIELLAGNFFQKQPKAIAVSVDDAAVKARRAKFSASENRPIDADLAPRICQKFGLRPTCDR